MEKINIILAEKDMDTRILFSEVFNNLKVPNTYTMYDSNMQLIESLNSTSEPPHLIFLNTDPYNVNGLECLRLIRKDRKFYETCVAVYSGQTAESNLTEVFIAGANIYVERPDKIEHFEKIIRQIVSVNWQYITDGLDWEKFMLKY